MLCAHIINTNYSPAGTPLLEVVKNRLEPPLSPLVDRFAETQQCCAYVILHRPQSWCSCTSKHTQHVLAVLDERLVVVCCSLLPQLTHTKYVPASFTPGHPAHDQAPVLCKLLLGVLRAQVVLAQQLVVHVWVPDADEGLAHQIQCLAVPATQSEENVLHACTHRARVAPFLSITHNCTTGCLLLDSWGYTKD